MEDHGLGSYIWGFILAVVLTAIPFYLVANHTLPPAHIMYVIAGAAVLQILVHLRFFLHLNFTSAPRENLLAHRLHRRPAGDHDGRQLLDHDRPAQAHGDLDPSLPLRQRDGVFDLLLALLARQLFMYDLAYSEGESAG